MAKNTKAFRTLNRLLDAGYDTEKAILSLSMEDMLRLPGITVTELAVINELQKHVKANKLITFLGGRYPRETNPKNDPNQQAGSEQVESQKEQNTKQILDSRCGGEKRAHEGNYYS